MTEPIADDQPIDDEDDGEMEAEIEAQAPDDDAGPMLLMSQTDTVVDGMGHLLATLRQDPGQEAYGFKISDWPEDAKDAFWRALTASLGHFADYTEGLACRHDD